SPFCSFSNALAVGDLSPDAINPNWNDGGIHPLKSISTTRSNSTVKSCPKLASLAVRTTLRCAIRSHFPPILLRSTTTELPLPFHPEGNSPTASDEKSCT